MKTTISTKKIFIIIVVISLLGIIVFILTLLAEKKATSGRNSEPTPTLVPLVISQTPSTQQIEQLIKSSPATQSNSLGEILFQYKKTDIPASGSIYTQEPTSIPNDMIAKIQEKLIAGGKERLLNTPKGQVILMQNGTKTLTIYLYSRMIVFSDSAPQAPVQFSNNLLSSYAYNYLKSLSLPVEEDSPHIQYFSDATGDLVETDNPQLATVFEVSFKEAVQKLTVFHQYGTDEMASVWFSKDGGITKFTYFYSPQYVPQKTIILPPLKTAEDKIRNNKAIVVKLGDSYQQQALNTPSKTIFDTVEVGYFNDGEDLSLYPIFVFRGTSVIDGKETPITVYLPAID